MAVRNEIDKLEKEVEELKEALTLHIDAGLRKIYGIDIVDATHALKENKKLKEELMRV